MGDTEVAAGVVAYFVALTGILALSPFQSEDFDIIESPSSPTVTETHTQSFSAAFAECLATGGFIPFFGQLGVIFEGILGFDLPIIDCSRKTETRFFQVFSDLFSFGLRMTVVFFQLLTFNVPGIPPLLNLLLVAPPAFLLAMIGIRIIRGVG